MKRILIITPHLSTGGLPQYLLQKIEHFKNDYEFYVVEWSDISGDVFVVQKNKLRNLLGDNLITLWENKNLIFDKIKTITPDVIHFEEIPETFIDDNILNELYSDDRTYTIVSTTHSSFTNPKDIRYTADKYILPSIWSQKIFQDYYGDTIPCEVWEYPTLNIVYDKDRSKEEMGFDKDYKHVLHVGLFTPGKNQKFIIDLAKTLLDHKIKFHFVGNQASNFEDYWKPLMGELPSNCIWHGERSDVDRYYMASDLFMFPSLYELNPLSLKEATSYGLPLFINNLETYMGQYDDVATYISEDQTLNKINILKLLEIKPKIKIVHLLTDVTHKREIESMSFISELSKFGFDYEPVINEIYEGIPPSDLCNRPHQISNSPTELGNGYGMLTGRHYGCFLAHTNAIKNIDENYDYTLIFEADANIVGDINDFVNIIYKSCLISEKYDGYYVSYSNNPTNSHKTIFDNDFIQTGANQDLAHAYMIPTKYKQWYVDRINDTGWDGTDIWFNIIFSDHNKNRLTTRKSYSNQIEGLSLIDGYVKWSDKVKYDYIEIGTSDFDTLVDTLPESYVGLSIDPIKEYLERLPNKPNNAKINVAITDDDRIAKVYLVDPMDIQVYNMPEWIKGCTSIDNPHPSVVRYLNEHNLSDIYKIDEIECLSFRTLIDKYKIDEVDYLKVDAEGHDFIILNDLLKTNLRPKKILFEANSLYNESDIQSMVKLLEENNYTMIQRTFDNIIVRYKNEMDNTPSQKPILILSTGRRLNYFTQTIKSLFDKDKNFNDRVKKVWVLDDRSTPNDRYHMDKIMTSYFGDNCNIISFNDNTPFYFINKFNIIKNLITPEDIILFLEDDWECHDNLNLNFHINNLINSDWTQIAFADPFEIQDTYIQNENSIGLDYWKNPYPNLFKHPYKWDGDICYWRSGSINHWTNNPSLIKGEVFFRTDFKYEKNFEAIFANEINGNQVFTQECLFRHFGEDSLIDKL